MRTPLFSNATIISGALIDFWIIVILKLELIPTICFKSLQLLNDNTFPCENML